MSDQKTLEVFEAKLVEAVEKAASAARNEERVRQSKILARRVSMMESKFAAEKDRLRESMKDFLLQNIKSVQEQTEESTLADIEAELVRIQEGAMPLRHRTEKLPAGYEDELYGEEGGKVVTPEVKEALLRLAEGVLDRVDVPLLKRQKNALVGMASGLSKEDQDYVEGIVNLLEAILDELEGFSEALDPQYKLRRPVHIKGEKVLQKPAAKKAAEKDDEEDQEERKELPDDLLDLASEYEYNPIKSAADKALAVLKSRYGGGRMSYEGQTKEERLRRIESRIRKAMLQRVNEDKTNLGEGKESDLVGNPVKTKGGYGPVKEIGDVLAWYDKFYKSEGKSVLKKKMREEALRRAKLREAILQIQADRKAVAEADALSIERKFALAGKEKAAAPSKEKKVATRESKLFGATSAKPAAKVEAAASVKPETKKAAASETKPAIKLEGLDKVTKGLSDEAKKAVTDAIEAGRIKNGEDLKSFLTESKKAPVAKSTPAEKTAEVEEEGYGYDIPNGVDC